ncbi:MAG TPA: diaminopimelate epimerase [Chitinophagales bacterium]|jgi:diaminopimelate epimerase|nr:diaminopimelate epimerase [Chitinophagales bacterium]HQW78452.1 diaminopimelate epimerase [Chitinophagales bacterium]
MHFNFYKYQGTGNDFVLIDNRTLFFPNENIELIRKLCDRKFGVGADGLMLLENIEQYDFKMVYYNADGNESTMCGNGGRCIAAFANQLGIVKDKGKFMAIDGVHDFTIDKDNVHLRMIDVAEIKMDKNDYVLFTGSPHYVSFRTALSQINILEEAQKVRYNDTFKEKGINVNFVEIKEDNVSMRTYERGVEDETLSCGTGTVAVALCVAHIRNQSAGQINIKTPGGILSVAFMKYENKYTDIWLIGAANFVFSGTINID